MRDYLFRGIGTDNEKIWIWRIGSLLIHKNKTVATWENDTGYFVNPKTVGQYTGKKDNKGVMIFAGDFLLDGSGLYTMAQVVWNEGMLALGVLTRGKKMYPLFSERNCVIIGNIHDNPELLEAE